MSVRPRKKIDIKISQNKAYQVILKPLVTEKSSVLSEYNKMVFSVPINDSTILRSYLKTKKTSNGVNIKIKN